VVPCLTSAPLGRIEGFSQGKISTSSSFPSVTTMSQIIRSETNSNVPNHSTTDKAEA